MVRLDGGQLMLVDMRDTGVGRAVMTHGVWEADNTSMMRKLVRPGTVCFDVGANYGYFALVMAAGPVPTAASSPSSRTRTSCRCCSRHCA